MLSKSQKRQYVKIGIGQWASPVRGKPTVKR
jgi:hypothetical protein